MSTNACIIITLVALVLRLNGQETPPPEVSTSRQPQVLDETTPLVNEVVSSTSSLKSIGQDGGIANFAFNPNDLEDVVEVRAGEEMTSFKGLSLEKTSSTTPMTTLTVDDLKNIYRVPNNRLSKTPQFEKHNRTADNLKKFDSFEVYKRLFDQTQWSLKDISKRITDACATELESYLKGLSSQVRWAMQASDQSGRYRGMFFFGNEFWVGSAGFCTEINNERAALPAAERLHQPEMDFFISTFNLNIPVHHQSHLQVSQCLPASCTLRDVRHILEVDPASNELIQSGTSNVTLLEVRTVPGPYRLWNDPRFQMLVGILVVCAICTFIATVYELTTTKRVLKTAMGISNVISAQANNNNNNNISNGHTNMGFNGKLELNQMHPHIDNNNSIQVDQSQIIGRDAIKPKVDLEPKVELGMLQRIVLCFGLISNAKSIISSKKLPSESVSCIHGMRVFSMLWTIMVHTYLQLFNISENKFQRVMLERSFWFQILGNATYSVDTFFFISGLLVTLLFMRSEEAEKKKKRPPATLAMETNKTFMMCIYRYVRLTPVYFVALLCSEVSLKWVYNQSVFQPALADHATCPHFWWRNILYIQNWFPFPQLCMIWSWYLANDMQFYVWAVIMLVISNRYFKTSSTLVIGFLLSSWIVAATISVQMKYQLRIAEPLDSFGFLYDMPWTRIGPYIMGMVAGTLIFRFKEPPKISKLFNIGMWLVSLVTMFLIIFGNWNGTMSVVDTAFFVSLSHTAWGFALIWITLSCRWGHAKPVNDFLSYPGFLPLSRLTYCTYLIHPVTQIVTAFQMQSPMHLIHLIAITIFLGSAVVSYVCAFILSLLCEAPVVRIMRIFFQK